MFTVRFVTAGDPQKPVNMRDREYATKNEALTAMRQLFAGNTRGALFSKTRITKINKLYIIEVPKP